MVKRAWFATLAILAISGAAWADDKADLQAAIDKLAAAPNYSWSSTTENVGGFGGGGGAGAPAPATTGMAEKNGYTVVTAPPGGGRGGRRGGGGGGFGGGAGGPPGGGAPGAGGPPGGGAPGAGGPPPAPAPLQIVMKGDKAVVKIGDAWKTTAELTAAVAAPPAAPAGGGAPGAGGPPGGGGFGGGGGRGGFGGSPEQQALTAVNAVVVPVKMAQDTAAKLTNVKKTADGFTADLPADTVKSMLAFAPMGGRGGAAAGGFTPPELTNPKGTLTVTLKDGVPAKIVSHMTGSMDFGGNPIDMDRTITTDIKDVGSTKVNVPAEAKAKLDAAK